MKKLLWGLVAGGMLLSLTACGAGDGPAPAAEAADLMTEVTAREPEPEALMPEQLDALTDFGLRLIEGTAGENVLLSPLSIAMALGMTANGAAGDTLTQLERALGLPVEKLNHTLYGYTAGLSRSEKARLLPANSIWYASDRGLTVEQAFLQTNADCYGAQLYELPFDREACDAINSWVKEYTEGMIPSILDELSEDAVMCLVNALAFEAEWATPYEEHQVSEGEFRPADGEPVTVDFLHSMEGQYLDCGSCYGVVKPYESGYDFVALLPRGDRTPDQVLEELDGAGLRAMLAYPTGGPVATAIPRFETEFAASLVPVLRALGLEDAFDAETADFSRMGSCERGRLYIGDVVHKTFLSLGEQGTRAGAATSVIMEAGCALPVEPPREVILDRPFVYMLVDHAHHVPFFLGTMDVPKS